MTDPRDVGPRSAARQTERSGGRGIVLFLTFLFMLGAVSVSTGLVVYTASRHDFVDGLFALAFAVLSARAALSWFLWRDSDQYSVVSNQQDRERRKSADQINR